MNDQQLLGLIAACALVMVPAGMAIVLFHRTLRRWLSIWLSPRHLKRVGERRRNEGSVDGRG